MALGEQMWPGNILWKLVLYASVWKLWVDRNSRVFRNKRTSIREIAESIVWNVSEWVCKRKEFAEISLEEDLN